MKINQSLKMHILNLYIEYNEYKAADMRNSLDTFSIFVGRFYGNVYFLQDV